MRSYIQPLHKQIEDEVKVKLPADVLDCLRQYCEFLSSPQSYVVTEIIRKALRRDKAFHTWREQQMNSAPSEAAALKKTKRPSPQSAASLS